MIVVGYITRIWSSRVWRIAEKPLWKVGVGSSLRLGLGSLLLHLLLDGTSLHRLDGMHHLPGLEVLPEAKLVRILLAVFGKLHPIKDGKSRHIVHLLDGASLLLLRGTVLASLEEQAGKDLLQSGVLVLMVASPSPASLLLNGMARLQIHVLGVVPGMHGGILVRHSLQGHQLVSTVQY